MDLRTFLRNICLFAIFLVTAGMIAVTPVSAQPTVADADPNQIVEINESIIFDGSGSQGNIIEYILDVVDGNTGSGLNPQHIYTKIGSYIASLTVIDGEGNTGTDWATVTVENEVPPTTPSNFAATGGDGFVSLTWNENTEADIEGYNIYRCTNSGGSYLKINDKLVTITEYNDTAVINDTTFYYYVITAVDTSLSESEYSSEKEAIPSFSEPTFVGGAISSDTTWNLQGSPYIITADIRIESGVSLTVEPGT